MHKNILRTLIFLSFLSLIICSCAWGRPTVTANSYDNSEYRNPTEQFIPQQKVYIAIALHGIALGEHDLNIDWIDPGRTVRAQSNKKFSVKKAEYYQDMFSFKIPRIGMFSRMFEGSTYPREFLGTWTCKFYVDGVMLKEHTFTMR